MLDVHALRVFLAAAETENFSEAGRRLQISQPAVSMQIRSLEEELGLDLFHRTGRHIVLTEAGEQLMPLAREIINRMVQVEETMVSLKGEVVGGLRIGCGAVTGKYVVTRIIAELIRQHPRVNVTCAAGSNIEVLQKLIAGDVQLALTAADEPYKEIEYRPYFEERLLLIVPENHPWSTLNGPISPQDLPKGRYVMYTSNSSGYNIIRRELAAYKQSLEDMNIAFKVNHPETLVVAVQRGIGVAFVPEVLAVDALESGSIVSVPVSGLSMSQTLYMARHTRRPPSSAQQAFWEIAFELDAPESLPGEALMRRLHQNQMA